MPGVVVRQPARRERLVALEAEALVIPLQWCEQPRVDRGVLVQRADEGFEEEEVDPVPQRPRRVREVDLGVELALGDH